jgi:hypothetical protein
VVGGFEVSVPAVDALSSRVASAASDTRAALDGLQARACVDTGDTALSEAVSGFAAFWGGFTADSARHGHTTAARIAAAAADYQHVDATVMPR